MKVRFDSIMDILILTILTCSKFKTDQETSQKKKFLNPLVPSLQKSHN